MTIRNAEKVSVLNDEQLLVSSRLDIVVVNYARDHEPLIDKEEIQVKSQDFKFAFQSPIKAISISQHDSSLFDYKKDSNKAVVIIYGSNSLMISIGQFIKESTQQNISKRSISTIQADHEKTSIKSFNELASAFKRCLQRFEVSGYITLTEENGNWSERKKFSPINVHSDDLLLLNNYGQNPHFVSTVLTQHIYQNGFTVWEGIIRDAIRREKLEITEFQLPRLLRPVMGDNNRSIIEHLCIGKNAMLKEIIEMPGLKTYYSQLKVKTPIFFNFSGWTPMEIALKSRDYDAFYLLVELFLEYQNSPVHFYLVK